MSEDSYLIGKVVHITYFDNEIENAESMCVPTESELWGMIGDIDDTGFTVYQWYYLSGDLEDDNNADFIVVEKNSIIKMEVYDRAKTVKKYSSKTLH